MERKSKKEGKNVRVYEIKKKRTKGRLNVIVVVDDLLRELIKTLVDIYEKPIELVWDLTKFGILNAAASLFVTCADVNEIISSVQCLNIAILQLWTM